jgi:hypothetical protein
MIIVSSAPGGVWEQAVVQFAFYFPFYLDIWININEYVSKPFHVLAFLLLPLFIETQRAYKFNYISYLVSEHSSLCLT